MHNVETGKETKLAEKCSMKELAISLQVGGDRKATNICTAKASKYKMQHTGTGNSFAPRATKKGIDKMTPEMAVTRQRQLINKLKVVGNEKEVGSERCQTFTICL